ncbi:MAG: 16S rRNA (cytosine(1402)-N(4))-methyltransferase RsmH [Rhodospirillales bacterium]|nr:16S rRNA (cytosine(1402)-N(4))-methyltransferase RsmH [Rhodospirillales bacterium]
MVAEVVQGLAPRPGGAYVDATFGAGGYAKAILDAAACTVVGIDRDPEACRRAEALCARYAGRLRVLRGRFATMAALLEPLALARVDGVAFDLGVSSPQIDVAARGFSFRLDGPLDMRMDPDQALTAADAVNALPEDELARILVAYGEERAARRIARAVVRARSEEPIATTGRLAGIVRNVLPPGRSRIDPATRTFQALRIYVNDELGELDRGLAAAETVLGPGGRLCVVAFHSLEDRRVKSFLATRSGRQAAPSRHRPEAQVQPAPASFRLVHNGAVRPSDDEVAANPRARSARLRVAERTAAPPWPSSEADRRAA